MADCKSPERRIMKESLYEFCPTNGLQQILEEWDTEKNAPLTPNDVSRGSKRALWWRCRKGHEYRTRVDTRVMSGGCPYCAGRKLLPELNSFAAVRPALTKEWDAERNGELTPWDVSWGSRRKVWWKCSKGHSWRTAVVQRTAGYGCPICTGKTVAVGENDLAACFPEVAAQWDTEKNAPFTPQSVTAYSNKKAWWCCEKGHSYMATVASRTVRSTGCPYCAGKLVLPGYNDLATLRPELAAQWHPTKNGTMTPQQVTAGSKKKVWWVCEKGHEWAAPIYSRMEGCGCPYCMGKRLLPGFNDLGTVRPDIAAQWHPTLNAPLTPRDFFPGTASFAWWICQRGHVWKARIGDRCRGRGKCPICSGRISARRRHRYDELMKTPPLSCRTDQELNRTNSKVRSSGIVPLEDNGQ